MPELISLASPPESGNVRGIGDATKAIVVSQKALMIWALFGIYAFSEGAGKTRGTPAEAGSSASPQVHLADDEMYSTCCGSGNVMAMAIADGS